MRAEGREVMDHDRADFKHINYMTTTMAMATNSEINLTTAIQSETARAASNRQ